MNWVRSSTQRTLRSAIRFAGLARVRNKKHPHQRRLSRTTLQRACDSLLRNESKIRRCKSFDELHNLLGILLHRTEGVGELYIYDTASRIGAKLHLLPAKVYLHRGTRKGAQALGYDGRVPAVEVSDLPRELRRLKPYEIGRLLVHL